MRPRLNVRPCVGGPHDGREATAAPKHLAFIDQNGRCWAAPRVGRALYECIEERWVFVGFGSYICKCGSFNRHKLGRAPDACLICGKKRPRPRRRVS